MEDIEDKRDFKSIDEKFDYILNHYDPKAIVAFFRNNAQMDAVIFEVGYICGKYGPAKTADRFWFAFEEGYDFTITTRYVRNLFTKAQVISIKDDDEYLNASKTLNAMLQKT
jgi:hypothetical protein